MRTEKHNCELRTHGDAFWVRPTRETRWLSDVYVGWMGEYSCRYKHTRAFTWITKGERSSYAFRRNRRCDQ